MAGTFRRITTYKGERRTSVTVPHYVWDEFVRLNGSEAAAIEAVKRWRDVVDSYDAASRMFRAVLNAARQGTLPGVE